MQIETYGQDSATEHRTLLAVSLGTKNRGPAHSLLRLLETQQGERPMLLLAPPGFLAEAASAKGIPLQQIDPTDGRERRLLRKVSELRPDESLVKQLSGERVSIFANSIGAGLRSASLSRALQAPLLVVARSEYMPRSEALKYQLLRRMTADLRLFAVSPYVQGLLYGSGASGRYSVRLLPNIATSDQSKSDYSTNELYHPESAFSPRLRILFIGSASRRKGFDVLLNTLGTVEELHDKIEVECVGLAGESSIRAQDRMKIERLQLRLPLRLVNRVADVGPHLKRADIAFLPAPIESFGRPIVEAAASGVLIICSDNPGHSSVVTNRVNALTFDVADEVEAASVLREAIADFATDRIEQIRRSAHDLAGAYSAASIGRRFGKYLDEPTLSPAVSQRWLSGNHQARAVSRRFPFLSR